MAQHDGVIEVPQCACGERMLVTNVCDVFVCQNCDGLQPQEVGENPKPRVRMPQDHAFNSEMRRRERNWYPDQFGAKNKGERKA